MLPLLHCEVMKYYENTSAKTQNHVDQLLYTVIITHGCHNWITKSYCDAARILRISARIADQRKLLLINRVKFRCLHCELYPHIETHTTNYLLGYTIIQYRLTLIN